MICRGGLVVGDRLSALGASAALRVAQPPPVETLRQRAVPWSRFLLAVPVVAVGLAFLPGRGAIPPLIESDYCYLLTAANRLAEGKGLSATPPVAPFQPWEWQSDWAFLTQWPPGYPLCIYALRRLGLTTLPATAAINILACAAALVGWFAWTWRGSPAGITRVLLAGLAAGSSVSVASLINPSTDIIVTAALPWILLLCNAQGADPAKSLLRAEGRHGDITALFGGFACGAMFWFRYASVFIPAAVFAFLAIGFIGRRIFVRRTVYFLIGAAGPIGVLILANRATGPTASAQAQLNLGGIIAFDFSWRLVLDAWTQFTSFGFYNHLPAVSTAFSLWPLALIGGALLIPGIRRTLRRFISIPAITLSALVVLSLLGMLAVATALFSAKFDYVSLERYYQPIKPLYFLLFVTPLMLIPRRVVRAGLCVALWAMCSWTVMIDWTRTYSRWQSAERPVTASGFWSRCFEPNAREVYAWLRSHDSPQLIVVSNFHEYIELETQIPAVPIPPDRDALERWIAAICKHRGVVRPRVLFVLDPDNRWRNHWISVPSEIVKQFDLETPVADAPHSGAIIREYASEMVAASSIP